VVAAAQRLRELVTEAGRDAEAFPVEAILHAGRGLDTIAADAAQWQDAGASHVAISTMNNAMLGAVNLPCATVDEHLALLQQVRDLLP
jgi:hypothetical protein